MGLGLDEQFSNLNKFSSLYPLFGFGRAVIHRFAFCFRSFSCVFGVFNCLFQCCQSFDSASTCSSANFIGFCAQDKSFLLGARKFLILLFYSV
jgi:hypothetical protein